MKFFLLFSLLMALTACDDPQNTRDVEKVFLEGVGRIEKVIHEFIRECKIRFGLQDPSSSREQKQVDAKKSPSPGSEPETASEIAKANSELLFEMMLVIFNDPEVEDKSNFGELAHTLNQGASLEGIYNGIIMGSRYRGLESKSQAASPEALKAFALEMAELQILEKNPTEFVKDESNKAPSIDYPEGGSVDDLVPSHSQEVKPKKEKKEIFDLMLENFLGSSTYTLKRVLGEESLRLSDELKGSSGDFAGWYAHFVLRMCDAHIDFGLPQRNDPNFDFHFKFAQTMSTDRVKWEVLNRYHRYMNHFK